MKLMYGYSERGGWYACHTERGVELHAETLRQLESVCLQWGYILAYRFDEI